MVNGLGGRMVGGRTEISDVKANEEVQELGRYSVDQYNQNQRQYSKGKNIGFVKFSEVVKAEKQVVSGIKYFLTVEAIKDDGSALKTFDAVVVVKPWANTKELLVFAPSTN